MNDGFMNRLIDAYKAATNEEIEAAVSELAVAVASYHSKLIQAGVEKELAWRLTMEFQNWSLILTVKAKTAPK